MSVYDQLSTDIHFQAGRWESMQNDQVAKGVFILGNWRVSKLATKEDSWHIECREHDIESREAGAHYGWSSANYFVHISSMFDQHLDLYTDPRNNRSPL